MRKIIIPSIIAKNQEEFDERFERVKSLSKVFQLDVMDGKFVGNKSLRFGLELIRGKKYEVHLMVKDPLEWIRDNIDKADRIAIHVESDNVEEAVDLVREKRKKIDLALNPRTSLSKIEEYGKIDGVVIMTVNPGKYGSRFLESMISKVRNIKKKYPKLSIEVDGGVNDRTISKLRRAGADRFVVGSYLQKSDDIKNDFEKLKKLIKI
jgi:ribulose-phosphate 3-epimerase